MKRTCEKSYIENGCASLSGYRDQNQPRAFGYGEWGSRAGMTALYNWAAANSLLPPEGPETTNSEGIVHINRSSVGSISEISAAIKDVQRSVDLADAGMTPIGLSGDAIPFDIDPTELAAGKSHFEQILERAESTLRNAEVLLDRAQRISKLQRQQGQSAANMQQSLANEEAGINIQLIGIFGYPYEGDIGVGGTYPQDYNGPDLYHYMWMDLEAYGFEDFELESKKIVEFEMSGDLLEEKGSETVTFELASNGMVVKPETIAGIRRARGSIQVAYGNFIAAYKAYDKAGKDYDESVHYLEKEVDWGIAKAASAAALGAFSEIKATMKLIHSLKQTAEKDAGAMLTLDQTIVSKTSASAEAAIPRIVVAGMSVGTDVGAAVVGSMSASAAAESIATSTAQNVSKIALSGLDHEKKTIDIIYEMTKELYALTFEEHKIQAELKKLCIEANGKANSVAVAYAVLINAQESYRSALAEGERLLGTRERLRKQAANRIASGRYQDMAFRTFRNDALAKYSNAFDLAKKYTYLATKAYDYETALGLDDSYNTDSIFREIIGTRTIGHMENGEPQLGGLHGDGGLADILARLKSNWIVLDGRLGVNNAQKERCWVSLRSELFRIKPTGDDSEKLWQNTLSSYRVDNLLNLPEFRRYCLPFESSTGLRAQEPGLVIPFSTTIDFARNVFGWPLAANDHAFDSSHYATKILKTGIKFVGYNATGSNTTVALSNEPRVYLIPVGDDIMRSPSSDGGDLMMYNVIDQVVPLPFPLDTSGVEDPDWMAIYDAYTGNDDPLATIRRYPSLRAYHDQETFEDDMISSTRLVGRSVWNTKWLLIIPAGTFHADRDFALDTLINGADIDQDNKLDQPGIQDIQIGFETYSNSGN